MFEEFKKFALRGNVVDLAIGVIIGAAFGRIVTSLVGDVIMPVIGYISGGLDFSNYFIALSDAVTATNYADAKAQGAVIGYGAFITIALNFAIIAWVLFLVVKAINRAKKKEDEKAGETPPPATPEDVALLREIRDLLAKRKEQ
ncbi:large conductance mechanosensitive channel [Thalassospira xiamenensis M-5 = DSM 17429]|uniref:Large-conductance mechanosensitive channel n=1 Tax=Thalassospira xiamenensis M-5 = DSM 17429 TaxID=1123366 RepID=A0AB72UA98_9PROT|nr:large conductance mechanosensitive channel protein MscL [Thalassospira xiamenensis]AJD51175.1 large-conductance mechanosensitive channel MscL [Thalassospira xiamenensis M-5 = DSM 17429]SIT16684.1 large conductance mechanosensitive channel [Thalassospira xiamenensis M-5 = DSM 17429]